MIACSRDASRLAHCNEVLQLTQSVSERQWAFSEMRGSGLLLDPDRFQSSILLNGMQRQIPSKVGCVLCFGQAVASQQAFNSRKSVQRMFSRRHLTASRELAPAFSRRHQVCKCKITRLCERNLFMDLVHRLGAPLKEMSHPRGHRWSPHPERACPYQGRLAGPFPQGWRGSDQQASAASPCGRPTHCAPSVYLQMLRDPPQRPVQHLRRRIRPLASASRPLPG